MVINRRGLLLGLASALAAPAIVHAENLMPIRRIPLTRHGNIFKIVSIYNIFPDLAHIELVEDCHPSWKGALVLQRGSFNRLPVIADRLRVGNLISIKIKF